MASNLFDNVYSRRLSIVSSLQSAAVETSDATKLLETEAANFDVNSMIDDASFVCV